jgi:hypothetical protein
MMMQNWSDFFMAVLDMREKQKAYFKARKTNAPFCDKLLMDAKGAEEIVDAAIKTHTSNAGRRVQQELFPKEEK